MMQGDQYSIPITGEDFNIDDVESIEFALGSIVKSYPDEVSYADGTFNFPVTQQETLSLIGEQTTQARVKFKYSNDVVGMPMDNLLVQRSKTRTIL